VPTAVLYHRLPKVSYRWVEPLAYALTMLLTIATIAGAQKQTMPKRLALTVYRDGAQLHIGWDRAAAAGANLEIVDSAQHIAMFVSPALTGITYQPESADVFVRLAGANSTEIARCLVAEPRSAAILQRDFAATTVAAAALETSLAQRSRRVDRLQKLADLLVAATLPPTVAPPVDTLALWRR